MKDRASASPLSRNWSSFTAGPFGSESKIGRGTAFVVAIPFGAAHLPARRAGAKRSSASTSLRADAYVEEALRWLPQSDAGDPEALADRTEETRVPARRRHDQGRPRPCRRRQRGYAQLHPPIARNAVGRRDGLRWARRDGGDSRPQTGPRPHRRDDAGPRRFRVAARTEETTRIFAISPIIVVSARAGEEARVEGLDAGADDYLTKPFSARELVARVNANLEMARIRRETAEALRARTAELEAVLETVPTAVWFTGDANAAHVWGNRQAAKLLRLPPDVNPSMTAPEGGPQHFQVFRDGVLVAPSELPLHRAARGYETRDQELEIRFTDGASTTILIHATPLRRLDGAVPGRCRGRRRHHDAEGSRADPPTGE